MASRRVSIAAALAVAGVAAAGCGGNAARSGPEPGIVDLTDPSQPVPIERFVQPPAAHIQPGDFVELRILGFPELSGSFLVAQDGRVNLSLIGSVQAAGKSVDELDRDLTAALGAYFRNLDVAVNINARGERGVYVLGEVRAGGRYVYSTGDRVLHALALAGGMTDAARENGIVLLRRESDGRDHVYRLDFARLYAGVAPSDIYLQPGDVVFVPRSRFRTVTEFAKELLDVLGRASTTALVVTDLSNRTRALTISR